MKVKTEIVHVSNRRWELQYSILDCRGDVIHTYTYLAGWPGDITRLTEKFLEKHGVEKTNQCFEAACGSIYKIRLILEKEVQLD